MLKFITQSKTSIEIFNTRTKFYVGELVKKSGVWLKRCDVEDKKTVKEIDDKLTELNKFCN